MRTKALVDCARLRQSPPVLSVGAKALIDEKAAWSKQLRQLIDEGRGDEMRCHREIENLALNRQRHVGVADHCANAKIGLQSESLLKVFDLSWVIVDRHDIIAQRGEIEGVAPASAGDV